MNPSVIAQARKLLVAAAGYAAALLAYGLLPDPWAKYAATGLAFLSSVGIYVVPNALTPKQIMAQPDYSPAVSHVPMPVTYNPAPNVDWTPVGQGAPAVHLPRRDASGRFSR